MSQETRRKLSGDEVVALSREIQAMIAAGVPLDFGLKQAGKGMAAELGETSQRIGNRLESGQSLDDALRAEPSLPPIYRAILVAGIRCGRSDDVLNEISTMTMHLTRLRQTLLQGLIYPGTVCLIGLLMLALIVRSFVPIVLDFYGSLRLPAPGYLQFLDGFPAFSIAIGLGILMAVVFVGLVSLGGRETIVAGLDWIPGAGRMIRDIRIARMSHILGLLVKYGVPLPEALRLTAETLASKQAHDQLTRVAETVETGESLETALQKEGRVPQFLEWLISIGSRNSLLSESLLQASDIYRERALSRGDFLKRVVPITAMVVVGGTITMLYAASVFVPMTALWAAIGSH
ncbi:MAG: type II secretion system F family protein [Planctomycetaceae bacterium]|nr:type II secretion system F family protein [Planctomycetaceae bacterium]